MDSQEIMPDASVVVLLVRHTHWNRAAMTQLVHSGAGIKAPGTKMKANLGDYRRFSRSLHRVSPCWLHETKQLSLQLDSATIVSNLWETLLLTST